MAYFTENKEYKKSTKLWKVGEAYSLAEVRHEGKWNEMHYQI